ncbi:MAG: hypothetical protein COY66_00025 [Candidatus Kerfeldbacteria bacterium CG_4_10_14_0_8_um_filter_42_10]|uniref:Methyltransferase domain-containing protein n=1 Tax=Candidatus Kerfeldbacteria bacterium CG_4_10_14_0_8_um_filter_42_10 TaxID=2014248 RepID=A0A2M7RKJ9_9BACT|nr:MAG: hypothetical protein COY66_00025 [Candidatus Kerfeldbacteria bacterium CG_4_10_14_0_8_um_filter_42_10]
MADDIIKKLTQEQVWDKIAPLWNKYKVAHFGDDRKGNLIDDFIDKNDKKILDLGCGSGRNFKSLIDSGFKGKIYGVDFSREMLELARENAKKLEIDFELKKANAWQTGYDDDFFDKIICIATIHCILKKENRKKTLIECFRVLKPKGRALITVWNKSNKRWRGKNKEKLVSWNLGDKKVYRYYYLYDQEELIGELESAGFKIIKKNFGTGRNIVIECEK